MNGTSVGSSRWGLLDPGRIHQRAPSVLRSSVDGGIGEKRAGIVG